MTANDALEDQIARWRAYLSRFLFSADRLLQPVGSLSGGERSRLLLARY